MTAGFVPRGGSCDGIVITEREAVADWNFFKENEAKKNSTEVPSPWDPAINLEANGYMYCFCQPKW